MKLEEMVRRLENFGYIKSRQVKKAMLKVDRKDFVPEEYKDLAYADQPLPIPGNVTISAPHMHAILLEELELNKGMKVLEIGFGSGILLAYIAEIVGKKGMVFGVEINKQAFEFGKKNLEKYGYENVKIFLKDGKKGLPEFAPYDRIVCSAAAKRIYDEWIQQLKTNGILITPLGTHYQTLVKLKKAKKGIERKFITEVAFVPLE